jgi:2'-5' RNA ligase
VPFAVTLPLDTPSAVPVQLLWERLADAGLSRDSHDLAYVPHLTLAVIDDAADLDALIGRLGRLAPSLSALQTTFVGFGVVPGVPSVLWLAPVVTAPLLQMQRDICGTISAQLLHPHYRPGEWVPHVTLAKDLVDTAAAIALVATGWSAQTSHLRRLELVRFRPIKHLWATDLPAACESPPALPVWRR